jgi:biotin carboxylase
LCSGSVDFRMNKPLQLSRDFGYPVMLKATAGGGEKE